MKCNYCNCEEWANTKEMFEGHTLYFCPEHAGIKVQPKPEPKELETVHKRLAQFQQGLITEAEMYQILDKVQIRGAMQNSAHYVGYDYHHQEWIETTFPA